MANYSYASEKCEEVLRKLSTSQSMEDRLFSALSELKVTSEDDYLGDEKKSF